jgi:uncharacterized protein YkwD
MSIIQPSLTLSQKNEISDYVNKYRSIHGSPPMLWDDTILQFSQSYSLYLLVNNLFEHSNTNKYGENILYLKEYENDFMFLFKKSIDLWYAEVSLYDFKQIELGLITKL